MHNNAIQHARAILKAATLVIKIYGVGGRRWKRNVEKGARIGPWLQGKYEILDDAAWRYGGPCLYLVAGNDSRIRYVGISRNGLKHRWRTSPAYDAETMERLPENQIFHSQCWKHIEAEKESNPGQTYEVRAITAEQLLPVLEKLGAPLSALAIFGDDGESVVAGVERWLCNHKNNDLVCWNSAMTRA